MYQPKDLLSMAALMYVLILHTFIIFLLFIFSSAQQMTNTISIVMQGSNHLLERTNLSHTFGGHKPRHLFRHLQSFGTHVSQSDVIESEESCQ